jgi:DNA end-binding protein Ku
MVEAMGKSDRAALGRFVMRAKEYLALVRVRDALLSLTTMRFHDEVRAIGGVGAPGGKTAKPAKAQLDAAVALIEALAVDWDPSRYEDRYRKRLQKVVSGKRKGKTVTLDEPASEPEPVPDLMAALEEALAAAEKKGSGKRAVKAKKAKAKAKSAA